MTGYLHELMRFFFRLNTHYSNNRLGATYQSLTAVNQAGRTAAGIYVTPTAVYDIAAAAVITARFT
jgi:hypothetical protein